MSLEYSQEVLPTEAEEEAVSSFAGFQFKNRGLHCRVHHLFPPQPDEEVPTEWMNRMTLYFGNFCEPVRNLANEVHCVACNQKLTGPYGMDDWRTRAALHVDTSSPTLEARCSGCAYPVRCRHVVKLTDERVLVHLDWFPLMYHPRTLTGKLRLA